MIPKNLIYLAAGFSLCKKEEQLHVVKKAKVKTKIINTVMWKPFAKKILHALPGGIKTKIQAYRSRAIIKQWEQSGKPVPPPHQVKQLAIQHYQHIYRLSVLVETGTYLGDMIEAQKKNSIKYFLLNWEKNYGEMLLSVSKSKSILL